MPNNIEQAKERQFVVMKQSGATGLARLEALPNSQEIAGITKRDSRL